MTDEHKCPDCGAAKSSGPYQMFYCGTFRTSDGKLSRSDKCRIAVLEAEVARLKSALAESVAAERERCAEVCLIQRAKCPSYYGICSLEDAAVEIRKGPQL